MASLTRLSRRRGSLHLAAVALGCTLVAAACATDHSNHLLGAWQATLLVEEGDTIEVKLDDVGLYFDEAGQYVYTSTLDYEETGSYRIDGEYLYRTPAGQDPEASLPVQIMHLDTSRLILNMVDSGRSRQLEFERSLP